MALSKPDLIVEEILLAVRRHSLSVNATRDLILDSSFGVSDDDLQDALNRVMNHMMRVGNINHQFVTYSWALSGLSQRELRVQPYSLVKSGLDLELMMHVHTEP